MGSKTIPEVHKHPSTLAYADAEYHCERCGRALHSRGDRCRVCRPTDRYAQPNAQLASEVGDRRFRLDALLARGERYEVYKARDLLLQREVALKRVSAGKRRSTGEEQLRREAMALARVRHRNVARLYHFGKDGPQCSLVMELVAGKSLDHLLRMRAKTSNPLPIPQAIEIMEQLLDGVAAMHAQGVVHGSLSVANVLIESASGRPVWIDFGRASRRSERRPFHGPVSAYTAPELLQPDAIANELTDIYALGFVLVQLLAHSELVFESTLRQISPPPKKRQPRSRFELFDTIVAKARAAQPEQRFAGVRALKEALTEAKRRYSSHEWRLLKHSVTRKTSSLRVLIADRGDALGDRVRQAARIAFFQTRVSVRRVAEGGAAVLAARERLPRLLLLDAELQNDDALRTLARIRLLNGGCEVQVMLLSAEPLSEAVAARWEGLGVARVLTGAVQLEQLVEEITAVAQEAGWLSGETEEAAGAEVLPLRR